MKSIPEIQSVLGVAAQREQAFLEALPPEERETEGTFEHWSAKDLLAHIAYWRQQMADKLRELSNPEMDPWKEELDEENAVVFERYHGASWSEVRQMLEDSATNLKDALDQVPYADLVNPDLDPWHTSREPWKSVVGNGLTHPISHLGGYLVEHGRQEHALQLQQEATDLLLRLDDSDDWRGVAIYNLACIQALLGEHDQALAGLREALKLAPRLVEWSKEDSDLNSLRADPRYQAIYQE